MSERKPGWYWVKEHHYDDWEAWYWNGTDFSGVGEDCCAEIDQRIPTPDEPWQAVPVVPTEKMLGPSRWARHLVYRQMLDAAPKPGGGDEADR